MAVGRPDWAAGDVDVEAPSAARVYDYFLGGAHNFAVDRALAEEIARMAPNVGDTMRAGREFLRRAVRYLVHAGIRQFLDIGSGIPTVGNVHEIAQQLAPETRVTYVDIDPVATAHSRAILEGNKLASVIQEDLRRPDHILAHQDVRNLLDFSQPIGLLLVAVMQFIPEEDNPPGIVARLRDALAPGSYVAMSQPTNDARVAETTQIEKLIAQAPSPFRYATRASFERLFVGWELVDPGIVWVPQWHPDSPDDVDDHPERSIVYAGVGRKA